MNGGEVRVPRQAGTPAEARGRADRALGREEAYAFVLAELERVDTWPDLAAVQEDVRARLAAARETIADLVS